MTGAPPITFRINTEPVRVVLDGMPKVAYFWLRDYLGRSLLRHRAKWLSEKSTKFGRGPNSISVGRLNERSGPLDDKEVRYTVEPDERRVQTAQAAEKGLAAMRAEIATGSIVLPVHEFGTDIRSARRMFVPTFRPNQYHPGNIAKWIKKHPQSALRWLKSKRDDKTMVYEVVLKRKRGRTRAGEAPKTTERLKLRWVGTKDVDMKPTLRLYASWDEQRTERDAQFRETADKMIRDMARGDRRDF